MKNGLIMGFVMVAIVAAFAFAAGPVLAQTDSDATNNGATNGATNNNTNTGDNATNTDNTNNGATSGTTNDNGAAGTTSTTPTGGVEAGSGGLADMGLELALILTTVGLGAGALLTARKMNAEYRA